MIRRIIRTQQRKRLLVDVENRHNERVLDAPGQDTPEALRYDALRDLALGVLREEVHEQRVLLHRDRVRDRPSRAPCPARTHQPLTTSDPRSSNPAFRCILMNEVHRTELTDDSHVLMTSARHTLKT